MKSTRYYIVWILDVMDCRAAIVENHENNFNIIKQCQCRLDHFISLKEMGAKISELLEMNHADADAICIASNGEYNGYELIIENFCYDKLPYPLNFQTLSEEDHWPTFFVIKDYAPIICRTFIDNEYNIKTIHAGQSSTSGRRVALGIDNMLGMNDAILLPNGQIWVGSNEIGHVGLSHPAVYQVCEALQHQELIDFLHHHEETNSQIITFDTILSKKGLVLLHQFAEKLDKPIPIEEIHAIIETDPASPALQIFARYLGLFINMVEFSFMPTGGIWITGKIVEQFNLFEIPLLNFVLRGRDLSPFYKNVRDQFPLKILQGQDHAFLGAGFYINNVLQHRIWF